MAVARASLLVVVAESVEESNVAEVDPVSLPKEEVEEEEDEVRGMITVLVSLVYDVVLLSAMVAREEEEDSVEEEVEDSVDSEEDDSVDEVDDSVVDESVVDDDSDDDSDEDDSVDEEDDAPTPGRADGGDAAGFDSFDGSGGTDGADLGRDGGRDGDAGGRARSTVVGVTHSSRYMTARTANRAVEKMRLRAQLRRGGVRRSSLGTGVLTTTATP